MEHSEIRAKNSYIPFYVYSDETTPTVSIYKVNTSYVISTISGPFPVTDLGNGYKSSGFISPDEDCYICILFGEHSIFLKIGEPDTLFLYYGISTGKIFNYSVKKISDGSEIDTGVLDELNYGFYYYAPISTDPSVVEIQHNVNTKDTFFIKQQYFGKSGIIQIEPNRWNFVTIPVKYGFWDIGSSSFIHDTTTKAKIKNYIIDQITDVYGEAPEDMIEVITAYSYKEEKYYNYVVGLTEDADEHNFPLVESSTSSPYFEVFNLHIRSVYNTPFLLRWGE